MIPEGFHPVGITRLRGQLRWRRRQMTAHPASQKHGHPRRLYKIDSLPRRVHIGYTLGDQDNLEHCCPSSRPSPARGERQAPPPYVEPDNGRAAPAKSRRDESARPKTAGTLAGQSGERTTAPARRVRRCRARHRALSDRPNAGLQESARLAAPARQPSPNWSAPPIAGGAIPRALKLACVSAGPVGFRNAANESDLMIACLLCSTGDELQAAAAFCSYLNRPLVAITSSLTRSSRVLRSDTAIQKSEGLRWLATSSGVSLQQSMATASTFGEPITA